MPILAFFVNFVYFVKNLVLNDDLNCTDNLEYKITDFKVPAFAWIVFDPTWFAAAKTDDLCRNITIRVVFNKNSSVL